MMDVHNLRSRLFRSIGWTYEAPGRELDVVQKLRRWRMLEPRSGIFEYHGTLTGIGGNGQAFRIADVRDSELGERTPGFRGCVVSFRQTQSFSGRTIIAEDKGVFNPTTVDLMTRIPFDSQSFEKMFEVYSDHEYEARSLFNSGFLEKMTQFSRETMGQKLQSCLLDDEIHFALNIDDKFSFARAPESSGRKFIRDLVIEAGSVCVVLEKLFCIQASLGREDTAQDKQMRLKYYKKCLSKMMETAKTLDNEMLNQGQAA